MLTRLQIRTPASVFAPERALVHVASHVTSVCDVAAAPEVERVTQLSGRLVVQSLGAKVSLTLKRLYERVTEACWMKHFT